MINKSKIIAKASQLKLLPTTVEKDYCLGWMLMAIAEHPAMKHWVFKGGTCLKKCYFENYRFSEDLDFTVPANRLYDEKDIYQALLDITGAIYDKIGLYFPQTGISVQESKNKRDRKTFLIKIAYNGPLNLPKSNLQRIKIDLTQDEVVVDDPEERSILHEYDEEFVSKKINCYSLNEILAEKTRALHERSGLPRDVYDVINICKKFRDSLDGKKAKNILFEKFQFKSIGTPSINKILDNINFENLAANWSASLRHQLPTAINIENIRDELRESLIWWIE